MSAALFVTVGAPAEVIFIDFGQFGSSAGWFRTWVVPLVRDPFDGRVINGVGEKKWG